MRRHWIAAGLSALVLIGSLSSCATAPEVDGNQASTTVSVAPITRPAAPDITEAGLLDGAMVLSVAKPHVSEAVEYYQVSVDGGEWRGLESSEWRPAEGGAGIIVTLRDPAPESGQTVNVRLRAVSINGHGAESRAVSFPTDPGIDAAAVDGPTIVSVDTALGLGGVTSNGTPTNTGQQVFVIIVEVLAALGLVSIGIFIGRRLRRS